jgi:hypothetical protein
MGQSGHVGSWKDTFAILNGSDAGLRLREMLRELNYVERGGARRLRDADFKQALACTQGFG